MRLTTDDLTNNLSGTLDARFYGKGAGVDSVNEFGGAFALSDKTADNQSYYYGAFGTARNYQTAYNGIAVTGSGNYTLAVGANDLISFNDTQRAGEWGGLKANTVELVKDNGTQTITVNKSLSNGITRLWLCRSF